MTLRRSGGLQTGASGDAREGSRCFTWGPPRLILPCATSSQYFRMRSTGGTRRSSPQGAALDRELHWEAHACLVRRAPRRKAARRQGNARAPEVRKFRPRASWCTRCTASSGSVASNDPWGVRRRPERHGLAGRERVDARQRQAERQANFATRLARPQGEAAEAGVGHRRHRVGQCPGRCSWEHVELRLRVGRGGQGAIDDELHPVDGPLHPDSPPVLVRTSVHRPPGPSHGALSAVPLLQERRLVRPPENVIMHPTHAALDAGAGVTRRARRVFHHRRATLRRRWSRGPGCSTSRTRRSTALQPARRRLRS